RWGSATARSRPTRPWADPRGAGNEAEPPSPGTPRRRERDCAGEDGFVNDARTDASTPASLSVDAYEEDWYRSLRALAERRRTELERFEDEDDVSEQEQERRPAATPAELTLEHNEPNGTQDRGIPALADDPARFWATSAPPSVESPAEEPTTVAQPAEEPTTVAQPAE